MKVKSKSKFLNLDRTDTESPPNPEGAIATFRADARYRDKLTAMPWGGSFSDYSGFDGMMDSDYED